MIQTNNPIAQIQQLLNAGRSPDAVFNFLAQSNPQVNQVKRLMYGKTSEQLQEIARNMCRERGTTIEDVARSLGIQVPSNR